MLDSIFTTDTDNNIIFYKWGGVGKAHIVNDKTKQKKLIKLIDRRDFFLRPMIFTSIMENLIWFLIFGPIIIFLIPLVLSSTLLGIPIFFSIKYFFHNLSNLEILGITVLIDFIIFLLIYSYQVDKVLNEEKNL